MTEMSKCLKAYNDNSPMSIGTVIGNSIYHHNAVRHPQDYTFEDYYTLWKHEELFVGEEDGEEEWEFMDD